MPQLSSPPFGATFDSNPFSSSPSSKPQSPHKIDKRTLDFVAPSGSNRSSTSSLTSPANVHYNMRGGMAPIGFCSTPSPSNSLEAYLLLEAARSDRVISALKKDLAFEMVHRNTIALQLNRVTLEKAQEDLSNADEHVGLVRFSIRQCGLSVAAEYAMREAHLLRCHHDGHISNDSNLPLATTQALDVVLD